MNRYDYIVAGAGAAGLSLVMHMIESGKFTDKSILLVDRSRKNVDDRTWCFWEEAPGLFESVVYKRWEKMWFHGFNNNSRLNEISPYQYKMIRSIDFYNYCFGQIENETNISVKYGTIERIFSDSNETYIIVDGETYHSSLIFSSILDTNIADNGAYFMWQHFKGWFIQTANEAFNPEEATLMDFRVDQKNDTRFVYVMPFTSTRALVEYTVFSENRLSDSEYDEHLAYYCQSSLHISQEEYKITNSEFGMIPMTNRPFPSSQHNIIYIGSAGGQTKASSGYTFRFIQKHSKQIVAELIKNNSPFVGRMNKKFNFYDTVLLKILAERKLPGAYVFTELFEHNEMNEVFKFLDNETSLSEDIKLISTLPKGKFINAAVSHFLRIGTK